jgi:hypothetical protein
VISQPGASASTPMSNTTGQSEPCHDTIQISSPYTTSSGPNLLAGRRFHHTSPIAIVAPVR